MGLKNFFKKQLSVVIEWDNQTPYLLFYKYPSLNDEIKNASKLIVAPGQGCIVVYEGKVMNVLTEEGVYMLESDNHPFITTFLKLRQSFESEHKMKLYFFRTAEIINLPWGTSNPIKYLDSSYKFPVELGAHGTFSARITRPQDMFSNVVGSKDYYSAENLRDAVIARFMPKLASYLAASSYSVLNIDANISNISQAMQTDLSLVFDDLGLELTNFSIEATTFSENTMEKVEKIGNMTSEAIAAGEVGLSYVELEKLKALRDAAKNEGGLAGAGLQVGAGLELSKTLTNQKEELTSMKDESSDAVTKLKRLKMLLDEGILTQEEFDTKKKQLLEDL